MQSVPRYSKAADLCNHKSDFSFGDFSQLM